MNTNQDSVQILTLCVLIFASALLWSVFVFYKSRKSDPEADPNAHAWRQIETYNPLGGIATSAVFCAWCQDDDPETSSLWCPGKAIS